MNKLKNKYEEERNLLIPFAEKYANEKEGKFPKSGQSKEAWSIVWNLAFLGEMNKLAKKQITKEDK